MNSMGSENEVICPKTFIFIMEQEQPSESLSFIINFSSNSSVKKKQILTKENLPNAWTPTPMDPMEKNELTFLESSRALMAIIN